VPKPLWRALRVVLVVVLVGVALFVGLTRTQVGRDAIRQRIETDFNQRFEGTLSIGELRGTLIDDFVATEVQLRDSSETLVATVDSIRATPRWANLLTAELSIQSLTLFQPHLSLQRDTSGTWNVTGALQQTTASPPTDQPLDLSFADIEVQNGRVTTRRSGAAPDIVQDDWLFDYTRTQINDISIRASARRAGPNSVLEIRAASFALPGSSLQSSLRQGRLRQTATGWAIADLDLSLGATRIRGRASVQTEPRGPNQNTFSLKLDRSRIDHSELQRLVPRLPLAATVTVEGEMTGSLTRLRANGVTVTHNTSFATVDGTISKKPETLSLDVRLTKSNLVPEDVRDVWPGLPPLPNPAIGPLNLQGTLRGTTARPEGRQRTFDLDARLAARSPHGAVQGSLKVARPRGTPLTYSTSLDAENLNLAPFTGKTALSSQLTGHVNARGTGTGTDTLQSEINFSLSPSTIGSRPLASANGEVTITSTTARGTLALRQTEGGAVYVKGSADHLDTRPGYTAVITSSSLNLAPLEEGLPTSALNARLTLQGSGTEWRSLTGTAVVNVDSSRVHRGDSTVVLPPHSASILLADRSAERPRLEISGSVATFTVDGTTLGRPFWTTAQNWGLALRNAFRRTRNKPAPTETVSAVKNLSPPTSSPSRSALRAESRAALAQLTSSGPIDTHAELRVHQPGILNAWWAAFPQRAEDLDAEVTLSLGTDSLRASGQFSAAHLRVGGKKVDSVDAQYELSGHLGAPLAQSMSATATISTQRVAAGGAPINEASASFSYDGGTGTLQATADSVGIAESLRMTGDVRITPRKNELRVREISAEVSGNTWTNRSPATALAYSSTLVVTPFVLEQPHPQTPSLQQIQVGGTLSSRSTDTLSVEAQNVYLPPFSEATGTPHLIGGNLSGQLHLRGGWGRPTLVGDLSVRRLSYDRRMLGDANFRVEYAADSPDLRVDGSLGTTVTSVDSLAGPDLVPEGARRVDPNRLSLSGRIRLPEWARAKSVEQASELPAGETLDLSVDIDRADLFFFRYIFEERVSRVQGYAAGPLHIGGRFQNPIFDANLKIVNGAATLPLFGLEYEAEGTVDVDRQGIHPREFTVRDDEGTATVNGSILFNDYRYFSFDLSASLDGITVIDVSQAKDLPFYGYIRASGPLTLTGPLSDATLRSNLGRTTPDSELFIPVTGQTVEEDTGFIVFTDSTGRTPDVETFTRRQNILADRPEGVATFVEGLNLDLNITAPDASTVHLVFDPIVGDVVTVVGSGRVQIQRQEGDLSVYGSFNASSGTYLFTAGEVFVRRFSIAEGTITWDGDPTNARLDLNAEYRTRASPSGLPDEERFRGRIPVTVELDITGRVATPRVNLGLSLVRSEQRNPVGSESLDAIFNQPARTTEYATSVLLTNTFLLTTESITQNGGPESGDSNNRLTSAGNQLAFNSVSQLVSSQLNRYLGKALPNVDLNFGVQGEDPNNLDLIYGVALRLLNERLVIRGEGVYTSNDPDEQRAEGPQGEFVVEVRLSSSVSAKVFYRRTGDELTGNQSLTSSRGAGVSYQTQFSTWRTLFDRLFGWLLPSDDSPDNDEEPIAQQSPPPDSPSTKTPR
jgi:hypothetical protein